MKIQKQFLSALKKHHLIKRGDTLVVGVSGGADSVSLLTLLSDHKHDWGIQLIVAHFNHNLRKGALTDQNFVANLAKKLCLPFESDQWSKPPIKTNGSLEERARNQRLKFFSEVSKKYRTNKVALAHTQDDLAETVLMRILRGAGLKGLQAMQPLSHVGKLCIIRPLLDVSRKDVEIYLKKKKLIHRTDPSNTQVKFFRNKVRLQLLPLLEHQFNQNIKSVLCDLSTNLTTDYNYLEILSEQKFQKLAKFSKGKQAIEFNFIQFSELHSSLKNLLVRKAFGHLSQTHQPLSTKHTREIEDLLNNRCSNSTVHLPKNVQASKSRSHLRFSIRAV